MPVSAAEKPWQLVADVGGTNARFAVVDLERGSLCHVVYYSVEDYAIFADVLAEFSAHVSSAGSWAKTPQGACLAVAGPVDGSVLKFTNSPWEIDVNGIEAQLEGAPLHIINDFAAVGYATTRLSPDDYLQLGGGASNPAKPVAVLGPGTGLGVCAGVPCQEHKVVIEAEGGHADYAPVDAQEIAVLNILLQRFGRVSYERLLSGAGILSTYQALAELALREPVHERPEDVYQAAMDGSDTLAMRTLQLFCRILGSFAGNLALTLGARGGVFIAGGIAPKVLSILQQSEFRNRFESKGRLRGFLADIPVQVITAKDIGLKGAAAYLAQQGNS